MNVAVFSDTHSNTGGMVRAVREEAPDAIIHLGDCIRDTRILRQEFPNIPLYAVYHCLLRNSDLPYRYLRTRIEPWY